MHIAGKCRKSCQHEKKETQRDPFLKGKKEGKQGGERKQVSIQLMRVDCLSKMGHMKRKFNNESYFLYKIMIAHSSHNFWSFVLVLRDLLLGGSVMFLN